MARGFTKRVVLNRAVLDAAMLGALDGLFTLGKVIIEDASKRAPDSPYEPYPAGEGLLKQGGVLAYAKGAKINGWSIRGNQPTKPRSVRPKSMEFVIIGGFGFPGHFAELGTIHEPARPFLTPSLMEHLPDAVPFMRAAAQRRLATTGERAARGRAISAAIRGG